MAYQDRIVFAANDTALLLKMVDAGVVAVVENRIVLQPGAVLYSHIGDGYGDGSSYALVTFDDAVVDMAKVDASLADNVDPSRSPLRIRAGTVIDDPDAIARSKFKQQQFADQEAAFADFKTALAVANPVVDIKP